MTTTADAHAPSFPRTRCARALAALLLVALATAWPTRARAGSEDAPTEEARAAFVQGAKLVEEARWAEALERFEHASQLRPHPLTTYNVAACLRALGAYTHARRKYAEARREGAESLAPVLKDEIDGLLVQLEGIVAHVDVVLDPVPATIAVDGRPLVFETADRAVGGIHPPGPPAPVTAARFDLELDPGVHTMTVHRDGHADAVTTFTTRPGSRTEQIFHLDRLPSTLRLASVPGETVVRVDGVDVGTTPLTLTRPPGVHRVVMLKPGFVTYDARVATHPGEDLRITGNLAAERTPITKRWWFWATLAGALVTVGVTSYAIVRATQDPEQAPFDGGSLGWTVPAR